MTLIKPLNGYGILLSVFTTFCAQNYYVASNGSDANDGMAVGTPFKTIQKAASLVAPGGTVYIRGGTYRETVTPSNSGSAGSPIVFTAYNGEKVTVSGADTVTGFSAAGDGSYKSTVSKIFHSSINQAEQIFVDGTMLQYARWPNVSKDVSNPVKSTMTAFVSKSRDATSNWTTGVFDDNNISPATDGYYVGAQVYVQPNMDAWSWTFSGEITTQVGKRLTLRSRNDSGTDGDGVSYKVGSRYFVFGLKKLLDANGEWFHDTTAGILYLRTWDGTDPSLHKVEMKMRDYAFVLDNKSYITIRNIGVYAANITTDLGSGGDCKGYNADGSTKYPWRGAGSVASANHILLDSINGRYLSHFMDVSGHFYLQWGQSTGVVLSGSDNVIQNSVLQYSAGNGITILGLRNKAQNNYIADVDYMSVDCSGICTGGAAEARDIEMGWNTIIRCGRSGITPRGMRNTDRMNPLARIHHNDISHCMLQDWDGGGLYTANLSGNYMRIDHNWVHDITKFNCLGLYADWSKEYILDHNVIWNCEWGIQFQGTGSGDVNNYLAYNNTIQVVNTTNSPYGPFGFAGSNGGNNGTVIRNNIIYCVNAAQSSYYVPISSAYGGARISNNLQWDSKAGSVTDPLFVNASQNNFMINSGSAALDKGNVIDTFMVYGATIMAYSDPIIGTAPDIGAYEKGGEYWVPGCRLTADIISKVNTPPIVDAGANRTSVVSNIIDLSGTAQDDGTPSALTYTWSKVSGPGTITLASVNLLSTKVTLGTQGSYILKLTAFDGEYSASDTVRIEYRPINPDSMAYAPFSGAAITLDGKLDPAWTTAKSYVLSHVTYGTVSSSKDLSAQFRLLYDNTNLYVYCNVKDDTIRTGATDFWNKDNVELYLDIGNKKNSTYGTDDYQYAFIASTGVQPIENKHSAIAGVSYSYLVTDSGYVCEIKLPWTTLGSVPMDSMLLGIEVQVTDFDSTRQGKIGWNTTIDKSWQDPSTFGTAMLSGSKSTILNFGHHFITVNKNFSVEAFDVAGRTIFRTTMTAATLSTIYENLHRMRLPQGISVFRVKDEKNVVLNRMVILKK